MESFKPDRYYCKSNIIAEKLIIQTLVKDSLQIDFNMNLIYRYFSTEKSTILEKLNLIAAVLFFIVLPIHVKYIPPLMILWGILSITFHYRKSGIKSMFSSDNKDAFVLFILFILYFFIQAVSVIYSSHTELALSNLFGRLSLIVFPIILIAPSDIIKRNAGVLLRIFIFAVMAYMVFCFANAFVRSLSIVNGIWQFNPHPELAYLNYFYSTELTVGQHPSYTAMYVVLSSFISFELFFNSRKSKDSGILWLIIGFLSLICVYFISSRAGLLVALLMGLCYFPYKFLRMGYGKTTFLIMGLILVILIPLLLKNQRVDYLTGWFSNKTDYERKEDPRFQLWKTGFKLAEKNLILGVGIGDVRDELAAVLREDGQYTMAGERYNAHNQFIEVLLENGIIGEILFIFIIIWMARIALKDLSIIYGFFILVIIGFFMFETILYRFAGVAFFSVFSFFLLYVRPLTENALIKESKE